MKIGKKYKEAINSEYFDDVFVILEEKQSLGAHMVKITSDVYKSYKIKQWNSLMINKPPYFKNYSKVKYLW